MEVAVGVRVGVGSHREDRGGAAGQHAAVRPSNTVIRKEAFGPVTSVEAAKLADDYVQARRNPSVQKEEGGGSGPDKRKCHKCGGEGHLKRSCPMKDEPGADRAGANLGRTRTDRGIKCFNCHRYGHMSMN